MCKTNKELIKDLQKQIESYSLDGDGQENNLTANDLKHQLKDAEQELRSFEQVQKDLASAGVKLTSDEDGYYLSNRLMIGK